MQSAVHKLNARKPRAYHYFGELLHSQLAAIERICDVRGLRMTPLRREVLSLIVTAEKPVKAYDLLDKLREKHDHAAPPTVYRALDFLLENQFIHKLESIKAYVLCHHMNQRHQTPFLICDVCSNAEEMYDRHVFELIDTRAKESGFSPQTQILEVHGICKRCLS